MATGAREDSSAILASLLGRFLADRQNGAIGTLDEYQLAYPGYEGLVAAEYARLHGKAPTSSPLDDVRVGPYRVVRELGRGGQGVVYLGQDERLQRQVAIKVLHLAPGLSDTALRRFQREAELASRLDERGICGIYDVGRDRGSPWIAMRYVEGETLTRRIAGLQAAKDGIATTVRLIERIARILHEAHEAGVVHRDIKPGNVMIDAQGEPVVLDFGLAQDVGSGAPTLTRTGERFGTPAYMAPEQLMGEGGLVDRRTDVWALGVVLYECLAAQPPFSGTSAAAIEQAILTREPPRLRRTRPRVPEDLEAIVERALEKDPRRRYPTALALAEDLRHLRLHEPVTARRAGPGLRLRRWVLRNPLATAFVAVLAVSLLGALVLLNRLDDRERHARALALAAEARDMVSKDPTLAVQLALAAVEAEHCAETISEVHRAVAGLHQVREMHHEACVNGLAVTRDGATLLSCSDDGTARLWPLREEGRAAVVLRHGDLGTGVKWARFSNDEQIVLTGGEDGAARLWTRAGQPVRAPFQHPDEVLTAELSPDGTTLLTGCQDGGVRLWNLVDGSVRELARHARAAHATYDPRGERILSWPWDYRFESNLREARTLISTPAGPFASLEHAFPVMHATFSPDGELVLTTSMDGTACLWSPEGGERLATLGADGVPVFFGAFSHDAQRIVTTQGSGLVRLWDRSGRLLRELRGHGDWVANAAWSADDQLILTTSSDQMPRIWDARSGDELAVLRGHRDAHTCWGATFVPGAVPPRAVTGAEDGTIRIWDLWNTDLPVLHGERPGIRCADLSDDGRRIAVGGFNGMIAIFDRRGEQLQSFRGHPGVEGVAAIDLSADGRFVATASTDFVARVWDLASTDRPLHEIRLEGRSPLVRFHPDGKRLLLTDGRNPPWIHDLTTGTDLRLRSGFPAHWGKFSRDGRWVVTTHADSASRLWDVRGELLDVFPGHFRITDVAIDAAGERIASTGLDGRVLLRRRSGQLPERELNRGGPGATSVEFSPDGRRLVTAHLDGGARIFTIEGELVATLYGHRRRPWAAHFSPDGRRILTTSLDGTARFWFADETELLAYARAHARALTGAEAERYRRLHDFAASDVSEPRPVSVLPITRLEQGQILLRRGQAEAAADCFRRGLAHEVLQPPARCQLAVELAAAGHAGEARAAMVAATVASPDDARAWQTLGWFLVSPRMSASSWEPVLAIEAAERAVALLGGDTSGPAARTLAAALYRAGRFVAAVARLEEIVAAQRDAVELAFLAMARSQLGDPQRAAEDLRAAHESLTDSSDEDARAAVREADDLLGRR